MLIQPLSWKRTSRRWRSGDLSDPAVGGLSLSGSRSEDARFTIEAYRVDEGSGQGLRVTLRESELRGLLARIDKAREGRS